MEKGQEERIHYSNKYQREPFWQKEKEKEKGNKNRKKSRRGLKTMGAAIVFIIIQLGLTQKVIDN